MSDPSSAAASTAPPSPPPPPPPKTLSKLEVAYFLFRICLGFLVLALIASYLGTHYRSELIAFGTNIVDRFGLIGMAIGTLLADGFQSPISPQFFMLISIAAGKSPVPVLAAIALGSITGGHLGMFAARRLGRVPRVRRFIERGAVLRLFERHGTLAIVIGAITPVPYSIICYTCGLLRLPYASFALFCALRVPKLIAFYMVIKAGWG